ncbi:MAG: hypothetical protein UX64_C0002G0011 [Microgenomates group bacterium GW2011_GWC2_46_7]|nr:MAG: hypothetical protein UX64_C0002G0011 [Microgenomates group bacterium GW2011_GWC2_46_7]
MKKRKVNQKWISQITCGVVVIFLIGAYAQASAQNSAMIFDYPDEVNWVKPTVLGDEDGVENEREDEHDDKQEQEEQKREDENKREEEKDQAEERKETEIETQDGQKIKTKVEDDGTTKVEIEQDNLKLKYEVKNGTVNSIEEDEDEIEFEDESENEELEISTEEERHTVRFNGVAASTNFPLSIDVATNELMVATKDGPKIVAVLPDQAILNLLDTGIVDQIGEGEELELQVQNGEPVYQIAGSKLYRLLAFIPITQSVIAVVSAETGEVVATQQSVVANIVDFLSP